MLPKKLHKKLEERKVYNAFRKLGQSNKLVDFSSNDYLGFSKSQIIFDKTHQYLLDNNFKQSGSTGSRLLSGNHSLYNDVESQLCNIHNSEAALIFNSGYNANIGFFSCVPQRGDIILYDELTHASIRDGIKMSNAKSYKFKHNDLKDLEKMLKQHFDKLNVAVQYDKSEIYIITESIFSMDGDYPDLKTMSQISKRYNANLIVDEAHALGVFGYGLVHMPVFARIVTFGKALGCHGAAILGSQELKDYLINFSRPFIYTTALAPHAVATIKVAYEELSIINETDKLKDNILFFNTEIKRLNLQNVFIQSESAIHCCIISGNDKIKTVAQELQNKGFDVKPILSPTVPKGKERLRFCLHSYNSRQEITDVLEHLANFVKK